ncbi:MAG: hypothetical protein J3K34DRAFT_419563 [Monoraphidium minutum]|nr:MAG: hypothetical protein J3K34DRAFT_419563 [Monoraphidium minutum]
MMMASSSPLKGSFLTQGLSWLSHLRRQLFPVRPGMFLAIRLQFLGPCLATQRSRRASSSCVQGPRVSSSPKSRIAPWPKRRRPASLPGA